MIKLRPLLKYDRWIIYHYRNNIEIMKWCRQHDFLEQEDHEKWFESLHSDKTKKMYAITIKDEANPIGVCGITSIDLINQRAEFSFYIAPMFQKKGYARGALKKLFKQSFERYPLNIIYGETFYNNPAGKLFKEIGMINEGTRRDFYFKEGQFIDAHLYSIKRSEFLK